MYCAVAPEVLSNRGASGIDGILHAALGAALASPQGGCTCLVGDVAALHDLSALPALAAAAPPLTVVILNNGGGGIFHYLPIASHQVFTPYFDTPHTHSFDSVCRGFGLPYAAASTAEAFEAAYGAALAGGSLSLIEVFCHKEETHRTHQQLLGVARAVARRVLASGARDSALRGGAV